MAEAALPPLIQSLAAPALHGTSAVRIVQTHISWVLLTGQYAYKIKKPVDFGFLDFSTLEKRHWYCAEELRLNRRLAPDLYLGVVAITGDVEHPSLDGGGPVLEYAVKLKQFDETGLADRLLAAGLVGPAQIDSLACHLATFHAQVPRATPQDAHGLPQAILTAAEQTLEHLLNLVPPHQTRLEDLLRWTRAEFGRLRDVFVARRQGGFIRECHGDLHCGNLLLLDGRWIGFDCIEFNEDLRWIDCVSEIAFVCMDMAVRGRPDLAWRLLNRYLEATGDYAGLALFDYYRVYRALVRAKVAALSLAQAADSERGGLEAQALRYLAYAEQAARPGNPRLLITHGFSGSGKSHVALALAMRLPAVRIVSDIERKRLAGFAALDNTRRGLGEGLYRTEMSAKTYAVLLNHAERLLKAGFDVVLDATYLRVADRDACRELAGRLGVRFFVLDFQVPEAVLRQRVADRLAHGGDPSEAGLAVLAWQMAGADALEHRESPHVIVLDEAPDLEKLLSVLGKPAQDGIRPE